MTGCTISLLIHASQLAYRTADLGDPETPPSSVPPSRTNMSTPALVEEVKQTGYEVATMVNSSARESDGLSALVLKPKDDHSPIVISFKGTDSLQDCVSDVSIAFSGVAKKGLREKAYSFYQDIRTQYPGREIILTGHSLGGHLAQYVGARAYDTATEKGPLQVRTFNTAPINTRYGESLLHKGFPFPFVNYRLDRDPVSSSTWGGNYGDTVAFQTTNVRNPHSIAAMRDDLPDAVKDLSVGGISDGERQLSALKEKVVNTKGAYAVHVMWQWQWFYPWRQGLKNKAIMNSALDTVSDCLNKTPPDMTGAAKSLKAAEDAVEGTVSKRFLKILTLDVSRIQTLQTNQSPTAQMATPENQRTTVGPSGPR